MNQYLVDLDLPLEPAEEFYLLIPEQRNQVDELMANGILLSYALASDRSKIWVTVNADSVEEVQEILNSMPLIPFLDPTIYELEFYNATGNGLPAISLN